MIALALMVLSVGEPIDLDTITVERARAMDGRLVVASFTNALPSYTLKGRTILGAAMRDDGAERGAIVRGNRLDIDIGDRVVVVGVIRVIDHGPYVVNGMFVDRWTDLRVEQFNK